jgi:hypothetical protein
VADDPKDPSEWPPATIVIRGGVGGVEALREALHGQGGWSVVAGPGLSLYALAGSVRNNQLRRTTVAAVLALGGSVTVDLTGDAPPYHCDLTGLTPKQLDSILEPTEPNPVPLEERWKRR